MMGLAHKVLIAGVGVLAATASLAQTVDVKGATAGETAKTEQGVTANGKHTTAGTGVAAKNATAREVPANVRTHIVPKPARKGSGLTPLNGDESGVAPRANVNNADQAQRSAESTAHKTVYDPNNQLGTSTRGTTLPGPDAQQSATADTNSSTPADTSAQAATPQ
jgi:hypothetical protein